jgi:tetratricopeptide (TPR) repeat protein
MKKILKQVCITTFSRIRKLNREKIALLIASLALLLGSMSPWYRLPPQALETFKTNLFLENVGRFFVALLAIYIFIFAFWHGISRIRRLLFWGALVAVLLFPYFITTWSPTVAFLAATYYEQGQRLATHVDKNFSEVQAQWKQNISLERSKPITSIFEFSIQDSRFFQMPSWERVILEGFGYRNSLVTFIGKGWSLTVIGLVISLIGLYLGIEAGKLNAFVIDMKRFLPGVGLLMGIILLSLIWVNILNYRLDTMFAKGEYRQVVATSQILASVYPPLRGDEAFLERMAEAGFYANEPNPALISFTKGLERYRVGDFLKAAEYFQKSLDVQPQGFLARGYLASALLNQGVDYFNGSNLPYLTFDGPNIPNSLNQRNPGSAVDHFEQALQIFPDHTEALYDLMLARVVNGEFNKLAETAQKVIEVQKQFQQPNSPILGQAYLHLAWASYHNDGDTTEVWRRYRQSIDSRTWKESVEEEQ